MRRTIGTFCSILERNAVTCAPSLSAFPLLLDVAGLLLSE